MSSRAKKILEMITNSKTVSSGNKENAFEDSNITHDNTSPQKTSNENDEEMAAWLEHQIDPVDAKIFTDLCNVEPEFLQEGAGVESINTNESEKENVCPYNNDSYENLEDMAAWFNQEFQPVDKTKCIDICDIDQDVFELMPQYGAGLLLVDKNDNRNQPKSATITASTKFSLAPDYDSDITLSDDGEINQIANMPVTTILTSNSTSKSSSSSSSNTNTLGTSSSPSFSEECESHDQGFCDPHHDDEHDEDVIENTPPHCINSTLNNESGFHVTRHQRVTSCKNTYTISPIFTDESDIDLSDNDPSVDFDMMLNRPNKNLLFVQSTSSDSDCDNITNEPNKKGRKRSRNIKKWKQNKTKRLRNTGESYTSMSKTKKYFPGRYLKPTCLDSCRLKCSDNFTTDDRYKLFTQFWNLGDLLKQRMYIKTCMVDIDPRYKYTNAEKPRRANKAYYFTLNEEKVRVCKLFFKHTLDISERMIYTVQCKQNDNGFMLDDFRGKHGKHKKLDPELILDIKNHINSIPRMESHYVRASTSRQYIAGDKNIKDLYNDFVTLQNQKKRDVGNYAAYYKVFNTEFNISFHLPKKDQCDLCTIYFNNDKNNDQNDLEDKYKKHLNEKDLSRLEKQMDRKNITKNDKVVIYDLEAVLQCPRGDTSAFYYKSKLNSYNFTLTELSKDDAKTAYENVHCYFWSEVDAKRGAIEIGSCIWDYLKKISDIDSEQKNIIFYSDNCCGQNKNRYITTLYMYAVNHLNISSITHKYLITGHTQNEADSVHSLIEKEVKKNLKSGPIYTPAQYIALIKNAKKSKPLINVHELTFESFMDIKNLQEEWGYNYNTNTSGTNVIWNDIKVMRVTKDNPFSFFYKTSYTEHNFEEVDVRNKRKKMNPLPMITLKNAYTGKQELSANKKKDLKELITKGLIPSFYADFYSSLI